MKPVNAWFSSLFSKSFLHRLWLSSFSKFRNQVSKKCIRSGSVPGTRPQSSIRCITVLPTIVFFRKTFRRKVFLKIVACRTQQDLTQPTMAQWTNNLKQKKANIFPCSSDSCRAAAKQKHSWVLISADCWSKMAKSKSQCHMGHGVVSSPQGPRKITNPKELPAKNTWSCLPPNGLGVWIFVTSQCCNQNVFLLG